MNEQLWRAEDEIVRRGESSSLENQGEFSYAGKTFFWQLASGLTNKEEKLYRIDLLVSWQEANKKIQLTRYVYAIHK